MLCCCAGGGGGGGTDDDTPSTPHRSPLLSTALPIKSPKPDGPPRMLPASNADMVSELRLLCASCCCAVGCCWAAAIRMPDGSSPHASPSPRSLGSCMRWLGQPLLLLPLAVNPAQAAPLCCSCSCWLGVPAASEGVLPGPPVKLQLERGVSTDAWPAGEDTLRTTPARPPASAASMPLLPAVKDPHGLPHKPKPLPLCVRPGAGVLLLLCWCTRLCSAANLARSFRATAPMERCVHSWEVLGPLPPVKLQNSQTASQQGVSPDIRDWCSGEASSALVRHCRVIQASGLPQCTGLR